MKKFTLIIATCFVLGGCSNSTIQLNELTKSIIDESLHNDIVEYYQYFYFDMERLKSEDTMIDPPDDVTQTGKILLDLAGEQINIDLSKISQLSGTAQLLWDFSQLSYYQAVAVFEMCAISITYSGDDINTEWKFASEEDRLEYIDIQTQNLNIIKDNYLD